jgi:Tfp pilus assembly protein PilX
MRKFSLTSAYRRDKGQEGFMIIYEVLVIFIFSLVMLSTISYAALQMRSLRGTLAKEQAFHIAEAGINYYQWHLAHFPTDYKDGTAAAGPYLHDYVDKNSNQTIGQFSLSITDPPIGSTIVTIQSTGWTLDNPNIRRTITTRYGVPSLARYGFLTNSDVWIGTTETVAGEMHANGGIRFDGTGNAPIQSAKQTYNCQAWSGAPCPAVQEGIWGGANQASRNFWSYPVPGIDFSSVTADLSQMRTLAQAGGIYRGSSAALGYSLVFNNNSTVSIYRVNTLRSHASGTDVNGVTHSEDIDYNGRTLLVTQALPGNGIIFLEDQVWVEGTVSGRVTVAAARLPYNPSLAPSIMIPNNLTYTAMDGSVSLGLIAQKDVLVTFYAPNNLTIHAAMIAQNGSVQRFYYSSNIKNSISVYGSIMSFGVWTWTWINGAGTVLSGYPTTSTVYDGNLLYSPPPSFPLTSDGYQQLSWTSN